MVITPVYVSNASSSRNVVPANLDQWLVLWLVHVVACAKGATVKLTSQMASLDFAFNRSAVPGQDGVQAKAKCK